MGKGGAILAWPGLLMLVVGLAEARQDRTGGPPALGQVLPGSFRERLGLSAEQARQVERLQQEVDDRLAQILTERQQKTLRGMRAGFPLDGPPMVHDVAVAREGGVCYLFSTGRGIALHTSVDLVTWQRRGRVFEQGPAWAAEAVPGWRGSLWAPDISYFGGRWHLYYSVSTYGRNRSAIGLATNVTLDPGRADHRWEDRGLVIASAPGDVWNAIDPNLAFDADGWPWLAFGSFWDGIHLVAIDPETGKPPGPAPRLHVLASRRHDREARDAIEAPFLLRRGEFHYLFASFDYCCRGIDSTYNIRVGRAPEITGPYLDRDGRPMRAGGGTLVRAGSERWRGPGHNAVLRDGVSDWLVYHAYDADAFGIARLRIEALSWDADGWPRATGRSPAGEPDE